MFSRGGSLLPSIYADACAILMTSLFPRPVQLFDACPTCDGAAAVVLTSNPDLATQSDGAVVRVAGSGSACDLLPVNERPEPLRLKAVEESTNLALAHAGMTRDDIDFFEL